MQREQLAHSIITIMPYIRGKLFKQIHFENLTKPQLFLLANIKEKSMPMSYYSKNLLIPMSNLTLTADKLIELGLIERIASPQDRRVVFLRITNEGEKKLKDCYIAMKQTLVNKTQSLNDNDIKRLTELLQEMRAIFQKIED